MTTNADAAGPLDRGVRAQVVDNLMDQVWHSQDGLISVAVTERIGAGWSIKSLAGRLMTKRYPDGVEVVELDGEAILELHPVRFEQTTEGGSIKIKAVQDYRVLRPN